jgi:hypothetical protein
MTWITMINFDAHSALAPADVKSSVPYDTTHPYLAWSGA